MPAIDAPEDPSADPTDPTDPTGPADLVVAGAELVATMDDARRELAGGWVAVTGGFVSAVGGRGDEPPPARQTLRADGCLVTPGLVNTHHHIFQNLTRAFAPATRAGLFDWLRHLYPRWVAIDEEAVHVSAWIGLAELALGGCTTSTDHLYLHPPGTGDLVTAEIRAAQDLGFRFHPSRGSMSLSVKDGGLPPDDAVEDDDTILADSERLVRQHHDPSPGAMIRVAIAPCAPATVTASLMREAAELAERLDVRLHTHLAEDPEEDRYAHEVLGMRTVEYFESLGWSSDRTWVAHCIYPNEAEIARLGRAGVGVAHCPSSNLILGNPTICPVRRHQAAGVPVGLGCDGSSSADSASLWLEARMAMLLGKHHDGAQAWGARDALEIATLGGAACLGRRGEIGQLSVGAVGDVVCWPIQGIHFTGAHSDPVEAWLRCGPVGARHTVIAGRPVVADGQLVSPRVGEMMAWHERTARRFQA